MAWPYTPYAGRENHRKFLTHKICVLGKKENVIRDLKYVQTKQSKNEMYIKLYKPRHTLEQIGHDSKGTDPQDYISAFLRVVP